MYAILKHDRIIAWHEEKEVARKFATSFDNPCDIKIIKIKKRKKKEIEEDESYNDLHLIRYKDNYLPLHLYLIAKEEDEQVYGDFKYCKDILFRIMETEDLDSEKDFKALSRVIRILDRFICENGNYTYEMLNEIKEIKSSYKYKVEK